MSKRKLILTVSILCVISAALLGWRRSVPATVIHAELSRDDLQQIKRVIRQAQWRKAFPAVSWPTIKASPQSLYLLVTSRIRQIDSQIDSSPVRLLVQLESPLGDYFYVLTKRTQATGHVEWDVSYHGPRFVVEYDRVRGPKFGRLGPNEYWIQGFPGQKILGQPNSTPTLSEVQFSSSLSNHAALTLRH